MKLPVVEAQQLCSDFVLGRLPHGHVSCARLRPGGTCKMTRTINGTVQPVHDTCAVREAEHAQYPRIDFTNLELWGLQQLAQTRQKTDVVVDSKWGYQRDWTRTWYDGLRGEYAVARYLGTEMDMKLYGGSGPVTDLKWHGITVETKLLQNWLTFVERKDFVADVAVLIHKLANTESVALVGWITRADFFARAFDFDFGYGKRPCVLPDDLEPMSTIWERYP